MAVLLLLLKVVLALVTLVVLLLGVAVLRKSMPWVLRGDLETLVASSVSQDERLASQIRGAPAERLIAPGAAPQEEWGLGKWPWPKVRLQSWRLLFPLEGKLTAHVTAVAVDRIHNRPIDGKVCEATISFEYWCKWEDNGRSVNLSTAGAGSATTYSSERVSSYCARPISAPCSRRSTWDVATRCSR
jgi:hypothetical protein